ncbi:MAG: hypothetical protein ACYC6A_20165 [Armatimonadota bacterium]
MPVDRRKNVGLPSRLNGLQAVMRMELLVQRRQMRVYRRLPPLAVHCHGPGGAVEKSR